MRLGTGVNIPGLRLAPVTANGIATINRLAPGRCFISLGTGHTAMRMLGQRPMPLKPFREYIRVVRALLNGEEVDYTSTVPPIVSASRCANTTLLIWTIPSNCTQRLVPKPRPWPASWGTA